MNQKLLYILSYNSLISSLLVDNCPWLCLGQLTTLRLDMQADMKTAI